jgi:hypothetical protein
MRRKALALAAAGIAATATAAYGAGHALLLGPTTKTSEKSFLGYYDGHKDTYLVTDVSSKAQAAALHVNFSPPLAAVKGAPDQYFVQGKAAPGQLAVFGSEPGESDYNPLWDEVFVTWKAGAKPVLLVKDDQIKALAKAGKLTMSDPHIVLNAPILKVGGK